MLRLTGQSFRKSGTFSNGIAQPSGAAHKGAAPLLGADHAFFGQHSQRTPYRMAIGGKALRQSGLGGQAVARRELAPDDVEADAIGDAPPQGDAAKIGFHNCHCIFT